MLIVNYNLHHMVTIINMIRLNNNKIWLLIIYKIY